ncbi:MAG: hypothetical protein M3Z09_02455 [Acidobacteriota bacterium]|nr:hypothetical protein [Acidobacteriota bacterium]
MALLALLLLDVLTYHNDLARTGQNLNETVLTTRNVNASQFGKRVSFPVDGVVYAQPLVYRGLAYAVTEHGSVYAFNDTGPVWQVSLLPPGATTVPSGDVTCGQITPEIGITATPVIDPAISTLYAVAMSKENGAYVHRLHALDAATGAERPNSPVTITASVPGKGDGGSAVTFIPKNYKERAGLLLLNGVVYTTWASHCDEFLYHGWILGYDAQSLRQVSVYNNTADARGASFWASGAAPAVDSGGNIYLVGGNGAFDADKGGADLGNSFLKLSPSLSILDYFTPFNYAALNGSDLDIGSSGALLLPDSAGSAAHPHLMTSAGKEGRIYLIDRDNMGKVQAGSDSQIVQSLTGAISPLFGIPAFFGNTLYFLGSGDSLKAFPIANGQMSTTPASATKLKFSGLGGAPSISANGSAEGIVWLLQNSGGAGLFGYDATDLTKELYNSNATNGRDSLGSYVKFSTPTIANGKVYAGTQNALVVYGLAAAAGAVGVNAASYQTGVAPGSIISIFGSGFTAGSTGQADGYPLPTSLAGASVTAGGKAAPLYYASPTQINAQLPVDLPANLATLTINTPTAKITGGDLVVQATAPGIFQVGANQPAIANQDGSLNTAVQPAAAGSIVSAFVTGVGAVDNVVATGAAAPKSPVSQTKAPVLATVNGAQARVQFAGLAPGFAGLGQINFTVPAGLAPGVYPVILNIGGVAANTVNLAVR